VVVLLKHVTEPPPHPTVFNPDLPQAVENVILNALNKNPQGRFQSAGELADALEKAVASAKGEHIPDTGSLSPERAMETPGKTAPLDYRASIFISYKRNIDPDEAVAMQIYQALNQEHDVFIDQTMLVGERWVERIESELSRADFLIAILSPQSIHKCLS
jgi:predicted nucleotide-binding protein